MSDLFKRIWRSLGKFNIPPVPFFHGFLFGGFVDFKKLTRLRILRFAFVGRAFLFSFDGWKISQAFNYLIVGPQDPQRANI